MFLSSTELPLELLEAVFEELFDDMLSLSNCAVTCKYWLPSARRLLFRQVHLNYLSYDADSRQYVRWHSPQRRHQYHTRVWVPDFEGFLELITRSGDISRSVIALKITGRIPIDAPLLRNTNLYRAYDMLPPWTALDLLLLYEILHALPSLTRLTMRHLVLQGPQSLANGSLPRLATLKLENVGTLQSDTLFQAIDLLGSGNMHIHALYAYPELEELPTPYFTFDHLIHTRSMEIGYLPDTSPILASLCRSSYLKSLAISLKTISDLRELSKLLISPAGSKLQELFIDLSTSKEQALSVQSAYVHGFWHSLKLSNCCDLSHFKSRVAAGSKSFVPSSLARLSQLISSLPQSVSHLTFEFSHPTSCIAVRRVEVMQSFRQAILAKIAQLSEVVFVISDTGNVCGEEEKLGKQEFITVLRHLIPDSETRHTLEVKVICD